MSIRLRVTRGRGRRPPPSSSIVSAQHFFLELLDSPALIVRVRQELFLQDLRQPKNQAKVAGTELPPSRCGVESIAELIQCDAPIEGSCTEQQLGMPVPTCET